MSRSSAGKPVLRFTDSRRFFLFQGVNISRDVSPPLSPSHLGVNETAAVISLSVLVFIQPLGSSCGSCSAAAAAVVLQPIPHPHRLADG